MPLTLWSPNHEALTLRDAMNRLFEESFVPVSGRNAASMPIDVVENADNYIVRASMPGYKKEDCDISFQESTLTIKANHEEEPLPEGARSLLKERFVGQLSRSITLPVQVDPAKAKAEYKDGVLTLTLPKAESTRPRQIKIG